MSQQTFATFYQEFLAQPENVGLVESFNDINSEKSFAAKAVEVGSTHGYTFTVDDVEAVMAASIKKELENVELSDQQLEAVAGGFSFSSLNRVLSASSLVNVNLGRFKVGNPISLDVSKYSSTVMCVW